MNANTIKIARMAALLPIFLSVCFGMRQHVAAQNVSVGMQTTAERVVDFQRFRNENKDIGLAQAIARYSNRTGLSKNTIRNNLIYNKRFQELSNEERTEYMKGSDYKIRQRKAKYEESVKNVSLEDAEKYLGNKGDAQEFISLRKKVQEGEKLDEADQKAYDNYTDRVGRKAGRAKNTAYRPLHEPYKPTKEEQKAIDECDRESARLMKEQKRYYENQKKDSRRRR